MEEQWLWYLAGAFDTAGRITGEVRQDSQLAIGYDFQPKLSLSRPIEKDVVFGLIGEYCEDRGIYYQLLEMNDGNSALLSISNAEDIERFLEPIQPGLIQQEEGAEIMMKKIIPGVKDGDHRTKEGFYEVMGYLEELRELSPTGRSTKYDQDYFKDEWNLRR